jgi:hypothetical protein
MLSTSPALREWDHILSVLADIKADAATHIDQPMPADLLQQLLDSVRVLPQDLTLPVATWKHMLNKEVSRPCALSMHGGN